MSTVPALYRVPHYSTRLVGREPEYEQLIQWINDTQVQLISIVGTAGIGKTRLATMVIRSVQEATGTDIRFVPLAAVNNHTFVPAEIGKALGIQSDDWIPTIREYLATWQGILVLDNMEHVIQSAPAIAEMIAPSPSLTVIVTSQRPLHVHGERVFRLNPLVVPNRNATPEELLDSPSMQLIYDRASDMDNSFNESFRDPASTEKVAEICRKLDGIPLALELAASRLVSLSPEVVLEQLERGQQILSSTRQDIPERQRTMSSAIGGSINLLSAETQRIVHWLGAYSGGFDLSIVEQLSEHLQITTPAIDTVSELVNLNLIRRVPSGPNLWYIMLEPIKAYCEAMLEERGEVDDAHRFISAHVIRLAQESEVMLTGPQADDWSQKLEQHLPTIRAAVNWAITDEAPSLPMLAGAGFGRFLDQTGRWREGVSWITQAETWREKLTDEEYIAGLLGKMEMQVTAYDMAGATKTSELLTLEFIDKDLPAYEAEFQMTNGHRALGQHQLEEASTAYERAVELSTELGNEFAVARATANLGQIAYLQGDYMRAEELLLPSANTFRSLAAHSQTCAVLQNLANAANLRGDPRQALTYLDEAIEIGRTHDLPLDTVYALLAQVPPLADLEQLDEAYAVCEEASELSRTLDSPALTAAAAHLQGGIAFMREDYAAVGSSFTMAFSSVSIDDVPQLYGEIGFVLCAALAKAGRYHESASLLAGYNRFITAIGFTMTPEKEELRRDTLELIHKHIDSPEDAFAIGESWSTDIWVRKLKQSARRLSGRPAMMIVTIPERNLDSFPELTPREQEVLWLLTEGHSTQSMAESLSISPRTITTHIANIMGKFDVVSRAELVAKAMRMRPST